MNNFYSAHLYYKIIIYLVILRVMISVDTNKYSS